MNVHALNSEYGYHFAEGVTFGKNVRIAPGVVIGSEGFGYEKDKNGEWQHKPHPFGVVIQDDVSIGANTVIDRGRWRDTLISMGTKIDGGVFIGHNVHVGRRTLITAGVAIAGSVTIGDDCWIGVGSTISDNIDIARNTFIGAGAVVVKNITEPGQVWVGNPARYLRDV